MTEEQKKEIVNWLSNSHYTKVIKFAKEKGYNLDEVFGIIIAEVHDSILDAKLGLE